MTGLVILDTCKAVDQGSFASLNAYYCHLTVARVYDGAVADHSNTAVVTHVVWPAAVACRLCVRRPLRMVHAITGCRTLWKKALHKILEARKGWGWG